MHFASRFAASTIRAKKVAFRSLCDAVGNNTRTTKITKTLALRFLTQISSDRTPGAANDMAKALRAGWNWGITFLAMPSDNPFSLPKFPQDEKPRYVPPYKDFQAVLALTTGKDSLLLLTALHTAARRGELFRLCWLDIDTANKAIRFGTRKRRGCGMQYDWLPMTDQLAALFAAYLPVVDTAAYVFPRPDGQPYITRTPFLRKLCDMAGVQRFGFHGIRHLSASMMAQGNIPIPDIQNVLRHKSPMTTARYIHSLGAIKANLNRVFNL